MSDETPKKPDPQAPTAHAPHRPVEVAAPEARPSLPKNDLQDCKQGTAR